MASHLGSRGEGFEDIIAPASAELEGNSVPALGLRDAGSGFRPV